jgi:phosphatidylglycerol:prolipoprotein diacylglycerol transferase
LFRLGPIVVRSYPALMNLGLLVGAMVVLLNARRREMDLRAVTDGALAAALAGLVLARGAYVGVHWSYYADHLRDAVRLWQGGLLWQGALLGGVVGAAAMAGGRGLPLARVLDVLTPGAACVAVGAWLACFSRGCAYGVETYPGQGLLWAVSRDLPDLYGIREPRVAVQLLGAAWSGVVLTATLVAGRRQRCRGMVFALWVTLHSLGCFGLGFLRADEMVSVAGWRVDQVVNLVLSVVGAGWVWRLSGSKAR